MTEIKEVKMFIKDLLSGKCRIQTDSINKR